MKRLTVFLCIVVFLIVNSSMAAAAYKEPSPERTATPIEKFYETPSPADPLEAQVRIREMVTDYGYVDEYYLSAVYWEKLIEDVEKYGPARRIVSLEYHGDNYSMYSGSYELSPVKFEVQMRYLLENDYHFVTGPELVGHFKWLA